MDAGSGRICVLVLIVKKGGDSFSVMTCAVRGN